MKYQVISLVLALAPLPIFSQDEVEIDDDAAYQAQVDSLENSFTYQHGIIELANGIGKLNVPTGYKYLDPEQSAYVLTELWDNPPSETLGMLFREQDGVLTDEGHVFEIQYDPMGYVKDDDAEDIDYAELMDQMKADTEEDNEARKKEGYPAINLVGWASTPYYDKENKVLHWAKELNFDGAKMNTLNYNVRILGRKGVMILNAIANMNEAQNVKNDIPKVMHIVEFTEGNSYADFDPDVDEIAAWTIGGLVAGKVLAKVGFFAVILKFWKIIAIAVAGFFTLVWKKIRGGS